MSLCMLVLIVPWKRGDGRYYFALWQTNNSTPNKLLLSESAVSCLLRVRSVSFTSRAKEIMNVMYEYKYYRMSRYTLNEVETSHHLILIRLYFILTILICCVLLNIELLSMLSVPFYRRHIRIYIIMQL
jgi:hypothetical protein